MEATVLIAEDDGYLRRSMTQIFEKAGFRVYATQNGSTALAILQRITPDVLILNVEMEGASSMRIIQKIRQSPGGNAAHIVLASCDPESLSAPEASLADIALQKPLRITELNELAKRLLFLSAKTEPAGIELRAELQRRLQEAQVAVHP